MISRDGREAGEGRPENSHPINSRTFALTSPSRINDSPTRIAPAPHFFKRSTSARVVIPLQASRMLGAGEICGEMSFLEDSPASASVIAEGTRRHDDGVRWLISKLEAGGALAPGLTTIQAVGLLSTLCSVEAFADLTARHGWTPSQCENWTTSALSQLLLNPAANNNATLPR